MRPFLQRLWRAFLNVMIAIGGVILTIALLNLIVALFFPVSDILFSYVSENGFLQRVPGQQIRYVRLPDVDARVNINEQGWNAPYDYDDQPVIAVVGDSMVEALQVDVGQAFPDRLEESLAERGCSGMTTYRFGVGGMPLATYRMMLEHVLDTYKPELVVMMLVENDYVESLASYRFGEAYIWRVAETENGYEYTPPPPPLRSQPGLFKPAYRALSLLYVEPEVRAALSQLLFRAARTLL